MMTKKIEEKDLTLYHFQMCPYCVMVRREAAKLGLEIKEKDIRLEPEAYEELIKGGGKSTVPCLLIAPEGEEENWMYESYDIVDYLRENFPKNA